MPPPSAVAPFITRDLLPLNVHRPLAVQTPYALCSLSFISGLDLAPLPTSHLPSSTTVRKQAWCLSVCLSFCALTCESFWLSLQISSLKTQIQSQESDLKSQEDDLNRAKSELNRLQQEETQLEQSIQAGRAQLETILRSLKCTQDDINQVL